MGEMGRILMGFGISMIGNIDSYSVGINEI